jgi:hypothetical protein
MEAYHRTHPSGHSTAGTGKTRSELSKLGLDGETLKTILIFCGLGLSIALLYASYGLDLSAGFF